MDVEALKAAGWRTGLRGKGFTEVVGPFWVRNHGEDYELGFVAEPRHSNQNPEIVHGGVLMTFADLFLGYSAAKSIGPVRCVTAQLQVQFVAPAKIGELVTGRGEVVRRGSQLIFMRGLIKSGDRVVASADGIWKTVKPK